MDTPSVVEYRVPGISYLVHVWNHRSETSYSYGPFHYLDTAETFCEQVDKTNGWEVQRIEVLNSPKLFSTGNERAFD